MSKEVEITELLAAWSNGDESSLEKLLPLVEQKLRQIAHHYMQREKGNHTLQTTALVNEAYLRLVDQNHVNWQNRSHFFAISAKIMRRILLNYAREQHAAKRRGNAVHVELDEAAIFSADKSEELIALDAALEKLKKFDELKSRIVELRYFGGLTIEETAEVLQIATSTVSLHWRMARAWLHNEIRGKSR